MNDIKKTRPASVPCLVATADSVGDCVGESGLLASLVIQPCAHPLAVQSWCWCSGS